jgi:SAM-dependent methyltransferase
MRPRLTQIVHEAIATTLGAGERAVDATVGNGHDTLFLAEQVGPGGQVAGFDIQPAAIAATSRRLEAAGMRARTALHQVGHEHLVASLPAEWAGTVGVVTFNLGYLPGGDKHQVTLVETTLPALRQACLLLRPGGILSVMAYPHHAGGKTEADAVADWANRIDAGFETETHTSPGPLLYLIRRRQADGLNP